MVHRFDHERFTRAESVGRWKRYENALAHLFDSLANLDGSGPNPNSQLARERI
jgi:hypothetical protein